LSRDWNSLPPPMIEKLRSDPEKLREVSMDRNRWLDRAWCDLLLRCSLAVIFLWFGLLKLVGLCPLAVFVCRTLPFLPPSVCLTLLGSWEAAIGLCLLVAPLRRWGLVFLFLHLSGTFLPLIVLPHECFAPFPYGLTLEGQYIVKNLVLVCAALVIASRPAFGLRRHASALVGVPVR
jgi:uncharacterized membrane protein YphA (DoxX/SURF4 family)